MRKAIEFTILPLVIGACVWMWLNSLWAAGAVAVTVLWIDVRVGALIHSLNSIALALCETVSGSLAEHAKGMKDEMSKLFSDYKGLWPL